MAPCWALLADATTWNAAQPNLARKKYKRNFYPEGRGQVDKLPGAGNAASEGMYLSRWLSIVLLFFLLTSGRAVLAENESDFASKAGRIVIAPHMSFVKRTQRPITRVVLANPSLADAELLTPTQLFIVGKVKQGVTSLTLWHGDNYAETYEIVVSFDDKVWNDVQAAIRRLVPRARVKVERLPEGVMLDGAVESQGDLDKVDKIAKFFFGECTNMITVMGSQQVQLEVKVAEVSRSGIKQLGLGFLLDKDYKVAVFPSGTAAGAMAGDRTTVSQWPTGSSDTKTSSLASVAALASPYSSAFQALVHGLNDDILGIVSLLQGQGLTRLLASPTLVTMSGQEAHFLVGGEIPYQTVGSTGTPGTDFKKFGVMLKFTPYVLGDETITISVDPEVSAPDYTLGTTTSSGTTVPGLITRTGHSTLQLKDGQVFAMAGLLRDDFRSTVKKIPFLGNLPILGTLFTSKEFQRSETELMIIVKPKIVRALNPQEVPALPGSNMERDVSDLDFFILNRGWPKTGASSAPPPAKAPSFVGEIGFSR
ncbi:type II and III secretion system protein [Desulfobacca acetoxidans DSM 11109]|uniref:Type II and III secretion system protein n=1 Tax=Desulfobacca acetoxidans (strain ATCC 700848 / DSM 11109 / ASRB2) TaxID=880072 RepID=F2NFB2_DESAR|nr:type II and III secretion system protein [Desulfobacca acetoxidans DSM 11109]